MPTNVSRKIKIWLVEKALNPSYREWEGEATAKKRALKKDLAVLNRKTNACHNKQRMADLWHRYYSKEMLLSRVEGLLET
jgi:hypothetical protein